jgi:hypothetical protein
MLPAVLPVLPQDGALEVPALEEGRTMGCSCCQIKSDLMNRRRIAENFNNILLCLGFNCLLNLFDGSILEYE